MDDIRKKTSLEIGNLIRNKEISSPEVTRLFLDAAIKDTKKAKEDNTKINAFICVDEEGAMAQAEEVQKKIDGGEKLSPLAGVPISAKDNVCIDGGLCTGASSYLENYSPPYTATVIDKAKDAGAVIIGKTNLDEFAMGASTETSYFGTTHNPLDTSRVPGGSSGGSAAAVAAGFGPCSIASDSGGSIRQPSAFCGVTGIKPTYGSVSRYGILAYASSLDQAGVIGRDARDCASLLSIISGPDPRDSTIAVKEPFDFCAIMHNADKSGNKIKTPAEKIREMKIGLPVNYLKSGIADDVKAAIINAAESFRKLGATVDEIELPLIEYAVPAFYLISCAEASSNVSRFDGIKYGYRAKDAPDIQTEYAMSRSESFGEEVKRRIMLGSFVLSSGYYDAYYKKALKVRSLIKDVFDGAFEKYDIILSPVSPTVAYEISEEAKDPLSVYLSDIYTVSVNMCGIPSISLPCGIGEAGMPVGMQLIGRHFEEETILGAAFAWQDEYGSTAGNQTE